MMKYLITFFLVLMTTIVKAACPVGSTCENYNGTIPYTITNPTGTTARSPADRASDHGVNILDFGATRGAGDSTAAIQLAIDTCYATTSCREIYCPDGNYITSYPLFLDPPGSLRGGGAWSNSLNYNIGDIVIQSGTYYRSTTNGNFNNAPPAAGWSTSPAVQYSAGASYSVGDTAFYVGMEWISLTNSNVGNTPNISPNNWSAYYSSATNANWGPTFSGSVGQSGAGLGCRIFVGSGTYPAMWVYGNFPTIRSVTFQNNNGGYRCNRDPRNVGIAVAGGSSSGFKITDSEISNFYLGVETSANGNPNVADRNHIGRTFIGGACIGLWFAATQNFLNHIEDTTVLEANIAVRSNNNGGGNIYSGNFTSGDSATNVFTMSNVTFNNGGAPYTLTATLASNAAGTWPDTYLPSAGCASTRSDYPAGCVYNTFIVVTPSYGAIPFQLSNTTPYSGNGFACTSGPPNCTTNTLTVQMNVPTSALWENDWVTAFNSTLKTELQAATEIYAVEMVTTFWGCGLSVQGVHIENAQAVTTVIDTSRCFGTRPSNLDNLYINYDASAANWMSNKSTRALALGQGTMPFIRVGNELSVFGMQPFNNIDRIVIEGGSNLFTWRGAPIPANPKYSSGSCSATFTCSNINIGTASGGFGIGLYDQSTGGGLFASFAGTFADVWRGYSSTPLIGGSMASLGTSPFWGVRPAPWSTPCVTPTHFSNIPPTGTLPTITTTGADFTGSIDGSTGIITVSSSTGLAANQNMYGPTIGARVMLGTQIDATHWNTDWRGVSIASQKFSTLTFSVPYPLLWGGQNYRVCDWSGGWSRNSTITNSFYSAHKFFSFGQDLTPTIMPGLSWSLKRLSPTLYLNPSALQLLSIGNIVQLQCNGVTKDEMVIEISRVMGYARIIDANQDGAPYTSDFGIDCTGSVGGGGAGTANLTIKQPAYVATQF